MDLSLQIVVSEQGKILTVDLGPSTTIGRKSFNRIQIEEPYISSRHALINRNEAGEYRIEDCQSKNGTFLNGEPVMASTPLHAGDLIRFGLATCQIIPTPTVPASVAPQPINWALAEKASQAAGGFPQVAQWNFAPGYKPGFHWGVLAEEFLKKRKAKKKRPTGRKKKAIKGRKTPSLNFPV